MSVNYRQTQKNKGDKVYLRKNYSVDNADMLAAIKEAQSIEGPIPYTQIANTHNVGVMALTRRLKGIVRVDAEVGQKPHLTDSEDNQLVRFIKIMADGGFGFCPKTLREFVETFMRNNGFDIGPSNAWVTRFLTKHQDLSKRFGKNLSIQRLESMNRNNLNDFYGLLTPLLTNAPGEVIFNCDEAGFCLSPKEGYLIAPRGTKNVVQKVPSDGHTYITVHFAGNAFGQLISPLIIFRGQRLNKEWTENWSGAEYRIADRGWMNKNVFADWLQNIFYKQAVELRPEGYCGPIYLLFDGHSSHTNLDVVELASRLNIVLIKLPSHSTHLLQPLDVSFFGPLKTCWFSILNEWNRKHNKPVSNIYFPLLLKDCMAKVKSTWLQKGFNSTGIFPVNPSAIPESKINIAKPWNNNGWRFFDESESVVSKLRDIDPSQCSSVMETCVLDHIINVLEPQPLPKLSTTLMRVPSDEERFKRGSRFGAVLSQPSTSTSDQLEQTLDNLKLESPNASLISLAYKEQCIVCNKNIQDADWICCSLPSCAQWLHTTCVPEVKNKTNEEISTLEWFCAICKSYRKNEIKTYKKSISTSK